MAVPGGLGHVVAEEGEESGVVGGLRPGEGRRRRETGQRAFAITMGSFQMPRSAERRGLREDAARRRLRIKI